ncbi:MAG: helix-turn-helix transcriptional regulator [Longimicrobiales bacterium]
MGERGAAGTLVGGTRGRILGALCERNSTAQELAERFGLTGNAVRAQLGRLQRDGLVRYRVERRGVGKPAHVYELAAAGELLLSRAYDAVLRALLKVLEREVSRDRLQAWLLECGGSLVTASPRTADGAKGRVSAAVARLRDLGGIPVVAEREGAFLLRGECCPLARITPTHPLACQVVGGMLAEATGMAVQENCDRSGRPHCGFELRRR